MNWFRQLEYKYRLGLVLVAIMSVVLLNNIYSRRDVSALDQAISAIYKDRLMPATYIFNITDHLYQKRLIQQQGNEMVLWQQHDKAITKLISEYEATHLTKEELQYWTAFKQHLYSYNTAISNHANADAETLHFSAIINDLNALSQLQAGVGSHLHTSSIHILNDTSMRFSLEIVLVIVLGLVSLMLLGVAKKNVFQLPQRPSLN